MHPDDLPEIVDIQLKVYVEELQESPEVIAQRLVQVPDLAIVAEDQEGICGYLFSYRSQPGVITLLMATLSNLHKVTVYTCMTSLLLHARYDEA